MLKLLLLFLTIAAKSQAAFQLFSLSPFRLDFSGHQIQEAHFQGTKRSAEASSKGAQVLLLLPQEHSADVVEALRENLDIEATTATTTTNEEPTTIHPKVLHLKEKADVIVTERAEKQKEKYNFNGRWEENVPEGSGDEPEAVTQDSVIEINGPKGIDDVESEPLTEKDTKLISSKFTKKFESLDIAKKSSKLLPLNEMISKKVNEEKRVKESGESLDETVDEIEKKAEEKVEKKKKKDQKVEDKLKLKLNDEFSELKETKIDKKTQGIIEKSMKIEEAEDSIPIPKKIANSLEQMIETKKVINDELEEKTERKNETTTTPTTTTTTTTSSKLSKQFWPTEVVIEGREFYLVPKNGRARDYLEPYSGGGYFLKKSPQDWFRGLHEQLRRETSQE